MENRYKVNMYTVLHKPEPYIKLLKREIKKGEGFVSIYNEKENILKNSIPVYAHGTLNYILGCIYVPKYAIIKA